jgi:hypothetical protein
MKWAGNSGFDIVKANKFVNYNVLMLKLKQKIVSKFEIKIVKVHPLV